MNETNKLTHFNPQGNVHMVDITDKAITNRTAIAEGCITMQPNTLQMIIDGHHKKGDVLSVARIAGIMATKKTADLIPLCHPIPLTKVNIELTPKPQDNAIHCQVTTQTTDRTGIEMEALTGVNITLLTIYDMCKAIDRGMTLKDIRLTHKSGGKSGDWNR